MPRKAPLLEPPHGSNTEGSQQPLDHFDILEHGWFLPTDDPPAPRRDRWIAAMRRRVIDTAVALLAEVGPRQFTVLEVARRSGIARTTIYKYFGLKAELLSACRHAPGGRSTRRLESTAARHSNRPFRRPDVGAAQTPPTLGTSLPPGLARLRQVVLGLATELQEEGDLWLLTVAEGVRARRQPRPYRSWELPSPFPSRLQQILWRHTRTVQQAGELPGELDPALLSRWLGALLWYHLTVRGPQADTTPRAPELPADLTVALTWLLRGAGAAACAAAQPRTPRPVTHPNPPSPTNLQPEKANS